MEFYSVELHSIRTIRIKLNTDIIFFKIPVKINKNTANAYACYEKYIK